MHIVPLRVVLSGFYDYSGPRNGEEIRGDFWESIASSDKANLAQVMDLYSDYVSISVINGGGNKIFPRSVR